MNKTKVIIYQIDLKHLSSDNVQFKYLRQIIVIGRQLKTFAIKNVSLCECVYVYQYFFSYIFVVVLLSRVNQNDFKSIYI